jgi:hypothetical protein
MTEALASSVGAHTAAWEVIERLARFLRASSREYAASARSGELIPLIVVSLRHRDTGGHQSEEAVCPRRLTSDGGSVVYAG